MTRTRQSVLRITTPEGITFALPLASPITRSVAWLVDLVIVIALEIGIGSVIGRLGVLQPDAARAFITLSYFIISIGYGLLFEWRWRGQTIGKKLLRLRVVDERGLHLHFTQIFVRNLLRFVDMFPAFYFVGGMTALCSAHGQRLGDIAANTVVVRGERVAAPDLEQIVAGKFNSFRDYPHLEARLRQRVSAVEAGLALQALLRRDAFEPEARIHLFQRLAGHLKEAVTFPAEAIEDLSDEQFVRNAVDTLYRAAR